MGTRTLLTAGIVASGLLANTPALAQMKVHFIDVGQGAATLIEFPCAAILVDAGGEKNDEFDSNAALIAYLDAFFAGRPELNSTLASLVLSHPHIDHTRGVEDVLARYRVLNAVTNGYEGGSGRFGQIALHEAVVAAEETETPGDDIGLTFALQDEIALNQGLVTAAVDPVDCGTVDPDITVLWGEYVSNPGWTEEEFEDQNNHSVVLRVDYGEASLLLPGDVEEAAIPYLISDYSGSTLLDADVLLAAHHGSRNGTTAEFMAAVSPEIAAIGLGSSSRELPWTAWEYGHPRREAFDLLIAAVTGVRDPIEVQVAEAQRTFTPQTIDKAVFATGWDGTVVLEAETTGAWRVVSPAQSVAAAASEGDNLIVPLPASEIDINSATAEELETLPLIGSSRAASIISYRATNGPFKRVEDLNEVPGIGSTTINAVRNLITVQ